MVKVTVKPLKGDTFEVEYEEGTLVKDLKDKIAAVKPEMTAELQKLIYSGRILENDKPLKEYSIKEGEFIVVMIMKAKAPAGAPAAPAAAPAAAAPAPDSTPAPPVSSGDAEMIAASAMPTNPAGMDAAVEQLMAMGFEKEQVEQCLRAAFGNPDRAVEYLMSGIPASITSEMEGQTGPGAAGGGAPAPAPAAGGGGPQSGAFPAMGGAFPAMPTGGGGGGGGAREPLPPALEALRNNPMFGQIAAAAAQNPQVLTQMLPALAQSHPEILEAVRANPEAFQRMLAEAAQGGGGGGGGAPGGMGGMGGPGGMAGMDPAAMAEMMQNNPEMMQTIVAEVAQSNPELAQQIQNDPQALARLMQAAAGGGMPGGGGGGGGQGQHVVRLTEAEGEAVARLTELGFDRQTAAQAYLACDKNEELAANYLFEHGMDDDA